MPRGPFFSYSSFVAQTNNWNVRRALVDNEGDIADLARLRYAWRAVERDESGLNSEQFATAFAFWLMEHRASHVGFIGSLGDEAVAMAWLALVDRVPGPGVFVRRCAYVQSVYVAEIHRNGHYGTLLMGKLIDFAREHQLDYLAVHPSSESFSFYQRLGFAGTEKVLELDFRSERRA